MRNYNYTQVMDSLLTVLKANTATHGVAQSAITEDSNGVDLNTSAPFLSISATPKVTELQSADSYAIESTLEIAIYCGVQEYASAQESTRAAMTLAGKVATVLNAIRGDYPPISDITLASTPIEFEGKFSDKTLVIVRAECAYSVYQ